VLVSDRAQRLQADLLLDAETDLGESPFWDAATQHVTWVDITTGSIHRCSTSGGAAPVQVVGGQLSAIAPRAAGGLIAALDDGIALLDADGSVHRVATFTGVSPWRMNDGKCDPHGGFWAGSVQLSRVWKTSSLWRIDPDWGVTRMLEGVSVSNGLDWSPDGKTLYYNDTRTCGVDAFNFDPYSGEISDRRRVLSVPPESGLVDGLTVDSEGGIWVALHRGGEIRRIDDRGEVRTVVEVPVPDVTSCCFGGPNLDQLFVTTAISHKSERPQPHEGGLFVCQVPVTGRLPYQFAG
jgi:sugar lactone lactonase YvrE